MSIDSIVNDEFEKMDYKEKWIIIAGQYNAGLNNNYMDGLEAIAKKYDYKIGVIPMAGAPYEKDEILHERLQMHTIFDGKTYKINDSLEINNWKVKPQKIKPLTGLRRFVKKNKSTIFGSPKQQFEHMPTNKDIPKLIATTGAVTKPHYNLNTEIGMKAQEMHQYGALIVEVIDDTYFDWRTLRANNQGKFNDYKLGYWDGKKLSKPLRADALNMGDSHYTKIDEGAHEWSINVIKKIKPKAVFDHDIFEGSCISHHTYKKSVASYFSRKGMTLDTELRTIVKYMKDIYKVLPKGSKYIVPEANHNEHLSKWLDDGRYLYDAENIYLVPELLRYKLDGKNPLEKVLKNSYGLPRSIKFLTRNQDYKIYGVDFSKHLDMGASGRFWSLTHALNNQGKVSGGHAHTGDMHEDVTRAGTRSQKRLGYNKGESSWSHTMIIYNRGLPQAINYFKRS